jgi:hypothetical protein
VTTAESTIVRPVDTIEPDDAVRPKPHRRRLHLAALAVLFTLTVAATVFGVTSAVHIHRSHLALVATAHHLGTTRVDLATTRTGIVSTVALRDGRSKASAQTVSEIAATQEKLNAASETSSLKSINIATLQACLTGVRIANAAVTAADPQGAVASLTAASSACLTLDGSSGGLAYPYDFPDPFVLTVGTEYYAFSTNSAVGNIQLIQSSDLTHWSAVGDALPKVAAWARPDTTWAPSVLQRGATYVMYYTVEDQASGVECVSDATATQPQGPYVDTSVAPLVCQAVIGGSIDPSPFVDTDGTPYLQWKSVGVTGQPATLWSQQLTPDGTALVGPAPAVLLQPTEAWQQGVIEGPTMVLSGGHYVLFYAANDWETANYAIGAADCTGPLGPCTETSGQPLLASAEGFSGPGGPSIFTDAQGNLWMGFHAWLPGHVGYPNSRPFFLRRISITDGVPQVDP